MAATNDRTKVIALVEEFWELHEKQAVILQELAMVAAGGQSIPDQMRELRARFCDGWKARYKSDYVWIDGFGNAHLRGFLVKNKLPKETIGERIDRYLATDDPFYVQHRHKFDWFVRDINSLVGLPLQHLNGDHSAALTSEKMRGLRGE